MVFKKCKQVNIDASAHFDKVGNQDKLTEEHVNKIVEVFQNLLRISLVMWRH